MSDRSRYKDPCALLFGPPELDVMQMETSRDPKIQTKKKEQSLKRTYSIEGKQQVFLREQKLKKMGRLFTKFK